MRRNAIVRLCVWSIIALTLIGLMTAWIVNDTHIFQLGNISLLPMQISNYRYKNADRYTAGNAEISERVESIDIDWIGGSVTILSYDGDTVRIREDGDIDDPDHQLHWFLEGGKLHVKYSASKLFFSSPPTKDLTVEIPLGWACRLSSVEIEIVSASLDVRDIQAKELSVEGVSGNMDIQKVSASTLKLETVSGAVVAHDLNTSLIDIETVSGTVSLAGTIEGGSVETTSGAVTLNSDQRFDALDLEAVSGDITLICPLHSSSYSDAGYRVVFESVSGDIETEIPFKKQGNNYTFGSGENVYNFDSVSGDLIVREP